MNTIRFKSKEAFVEALEGRRKFWQQYDRRQGGELRLTDAPRCPNLMETKIDGVLAALEHTQGKAFTVDTSGTWSEAHNLLTWDPDARKTVC